MSDDERIERARRFGEHMRRAADEQRIAAMEAALAETPAMRDGIPMPSTCHPFYAEQRQFIIDWLDGRTFVDLRTLLIPKPHRVTVADFMNADPSATFVPATLALHRHRVRAPAPYVGEPYMLTWHVAEDDSGRTVAGAVSYEFLSVRGAL